MFCHPHEQPQRQIWWRRHEVRDAPQVAIERKDLRCLRDLACTVSAGDVPERNTYLAEHDDPNTFAPPLRARSISRVDAGASYRKFRLHVTRSTVVCIISELVHQVSDEGWERRQRGKDSDGDRRRIQL